MPAEIVRLMLLLKVNGLAVGLSGVTERVVDEVLTPLVYDGPAKGMLRAGNIHETSVEVATGSGFQADPVQNFFLERYAYAYSHELEQFILSIANGEVLNPTFEDGRAALILADAAQLSAETGKTVKVDLS